MSEALTLGSDGKPFNNLIEHFFGDLDFDAILKGLESIPKDRVQLRLEYLADKIPGLPLIADCLASEQQLAVKKRLNAQLLDHLKADQPGIEANIAWQSSCAYNDIFDNLLAKSPVLTPSDIEEAKSIPLPSGGRVFLFEMLKTTQKDASVTEWHWFPVAITKEGEWKFLDGVWNLWDIPTADKEVLADYYGQATSKFQRMPDPATAFERFHGTSIGPQDMTLGGRYEHDKTYVIRSEKVFGWDRTAKGRPFWRVRNVLERRNVSPHKLRHFMAVAFLVERSNAKGSPLSFDTHYILNSCLTTLIASLFFDDPFLQNKPLHDLMLRLGDTADLIHLSMSRQATVEEFFEKYLRDAPSTFAKSTKAEYERQIIGTMKMKTLRESHDGQPPFISCYSGNHAVPQNAALAKLLTIAEELSIDALKVMVGSL